MSDDRIAALEARIAAIEAAHAETKEQLMATRRLLLIAARDLGYQRFDALYTPPSYELFWAMHKDIFGE